MSSTDEVVLRQVDRIGGEECAPAGVLNDWLCNPSTGKRVAQQAATDLVSVDRAIGIAAEVDRAGTWRNLGIDERARYLERIAELLTPLAEQVGVAESLTSGIPITIARAFGGSLAGNFLDAVERLRASVPIVELGEPDRPVELLRVPWGPTVVMVPFNAPAAQAAKKVAYALAAGAPVILKPPEHGPFGCNLLADAIDAADLPPGVFQMVHGGAEVGRALTTDSRIRAVSFTGGVEVGRAVARAGADDFKALQLELGGNNPVVIRADADVNSAARVLADGIVKLNGQWCEAPGKLLVARSLVEPLVEALAHEMRQVRIGAHDDEEAALGPLAFEAHRTRLDAHIAALESAGGRVIICGETPGDEGWFWAPRIVVNAPATAAVEEMFGPVVTVHAVDSDAEAVQIANESPYGLAAYVFGGDIEAAMAVGRELRFGEVKINGTSLLDMSPDSAQSFWRCSGSGGHGNTALFEFFLGTQIVGMDRPGLPI